MRLVIFTPAVLASAIGRVTQLLEHELLRNGHEVVIVRSEDDPHINSDAHLFASRPVRWDDTPRVEQMLQHADAIVYQIGNNYPFHRGALEWLPKAPGVVCLHDYFLAHMFSRWAEQHREQAIVILQTWYGEQAAQQFFAHSNAEEFIEETRNYAPMTEWIASQATGVITHSSWDIHRLLRACPGPVQVLALPYRGTALALQQEQDHPSGLSSSDQGSHTSGYPHFNVLTVGHMNPNKRLDIVIRAIGKSAVLRDKTTYYLTGFIENQYAQRLTSLARNFGVHVSIAGEVNEIQLAQAIEQADVMCCLRLPVLESASASTIEAMLSAKATMVTDVGFYSELPDNCVCKVSPAQEVDDVQRILESLCTHPEERQALGARAAAWATSTFSAATYAEHLVRVSQRAMTAAPAIEASKYFADVLLRWGATESLVASSSVASFLTPLGQVAHGKVDAPLTDATG